MADKPNIEGALVELANYQTMLQTELNCLEDEMDEEITETAQIKLNELQARIDLVYNAIISLEDLE